MNAIAERVFGNKIEYATQLTTAWLRSYQKESRPCLGRGPNSRSDDVTLPKQPRGFCLGFSLAEGQVVIT